MDDLKQRIYPHRQYGVPNAAMSDLYRAKYGMPLDGESHERFIATKVPKRKNKDYRARFRSYSFGYPTYKKDTYLRHWYNFIDIISNKEAPLLRYAKFYLASYFTGTLVGALGGFNPLNPKNPGLKIIEHKMVTSSNYVKFSFFSELRNSLSVGKSTGIVYGVFSTAWYILYDKFRQWNYSNAQSILRSTFIIVPAYLFFHYDRPFTNFWYRSAIVSIIATTILYEILVDNNSTMLGPVIGNDNIEKFYLKSVSPQEILKIEFEDKMERFGYIFEKRNDINLYGAYDANN